MGKATAAKNSEPLEPRRYLNELNKLRRTKKYRILFVIDDLLSKIEDDNEAVLFIEHLIDFLGKDLKYGIPYLFKDNDVKYKCYKYVLEAERYWRKMKMLSTETGRKYLKKGKIIYLTQPNVPENYNINETTIVPDLDTPYIVISEDNIIKSTLHWNKKTIDLVALFYSLNWSKKIWVDETDEVTEKFTQFENFFNIKDKVKRPPNRQQELMSKSIELKFIYGIHNNLRKLFRDKNTVVLVEENLIDESLEVPFGSIYLSDIEWLGSDEEFVELYYALKLSGSFTCDGGIDPFLQFCLFFHYSVSNPNEILRVIVRKFMDKRTTSLAMLRDLAIENYHLTKEKRRKQ